MVRLRKPTAFYYVLCYGGRDFRDTKLIDAEMKKIITYVDSIGRRPFFVTGGARGADTLCRLWAAINGMAHASLPAEWDLFNGDAGWTRNQQMLDMFPIDRGLAFPGGAGTADMTWRCNNSDIPVTEVK